MGKVTCYLKYHHQKMVNPYWTRPHYRLYKFIKRLALVVGLALLYWALVDVGSLLEWAVSISGEKLNVEQ